MKKRTSGMGFVGLIVLVTILTIMANVMIPSGFPNLENERRRTTTENIAIIATALENYYQANQTFPPALNILETSNPPYLVAKFTNTVASDNEVLYDKWRMNYAYNVTGVYTREIRSSGPDRIMGNADDIFTTVDVSEYAFKNTDELRATTQQEMAVINAAITNYRTRFPPASFPPTPPAPMDNRNLAGYAGNWAGALIPLQGLITSPIPQNIVFLPATNDYYRDQFGNPYSFDGTKVTSPNVP